MKLINNALKIRNRMGFTQQKKDLHVNINKNNLKVNLYSINAKSKLNTLAKNLPIILLVTLGFIIPFKSLLMQLGLSCLCVIPAFLGAIISLTLLKCYNDDNIPNCFEYMKKIIFVIFSHSIMLIPHFLCSPECTGIYGWLLYIICPIITYTGLLNINIIIPNQEHKSIFICMVNPDTGSSSDPVYPASDPRRIRGYDPSRGMTQQSYEFYYNRQIEQENLRPELLLEQLGPELRAGYYKEKLVQDDRRNMAQGQHGVSPLFYIFYHMLHVERRLELRNNDNLSLRNFLLFEDSHEGRDFKRFCRQYNGNDTFVIDVCNRVNNGQE